LTELTEFYRHCTNNSSLQGEIFKQNAIGYFILRKYLKNIKLYTVNNLLTQTMLYYLITHFHLTSHYSLRLTSATIHITLENI